METVRRSINTRHLFWKVMERWKLILIAAVIGCIAGTGYAMLKQKTENKKLQQGQKLVMTEITVTEEEFANVYSMASAYDSIQAQKDYSKQNIWMKCQNFIKGTAKAVYQIQAETDLEKSQIATLYTDILANNETYNELASQEGMRVEYLREGIAYSVPAGGILRLEITSYSKEKAQEWLDQIEKILEMQKKGLEKEKGISFRIKKVYKNNIEVFDSGIADRQRASMTNITTAQTNYDNAVAALPSNQKYYLECYLQSRNDENYVKGQSFQREIPVEEPTVEESTAAGGTPIEEEVPLTEEEREELFQKRLKTDRVLGAILGGFAVCLFFILKYVYSPILMNTEELSMMYGLPILGGINVSKTKKGRKKENKDIDNIEEYRKIIARIGIQDVRGEKIYITGTQINESYMELLAQEGKKQDILFIPGKDFMKDSNAMIELRDCDSVIFLEKEGISKYIEIEEEVKICKESNKKVIGVVMV